MHQVLGGLLKAAEDLKQRIREETTLALSESRDELEKVEAEIAAARQELDEVHESQTSTASAATEQERDAILAAARAEANRIVEAAQAEREQMLAEIRATEERMRGLQNQIQALLGGGMVAAPTQAPPPVPPAVEPERIAPEPAALTPSFSSAPPVAPEPEPAPSTPSFSTAPMVSEPEPAPAPPAPIAPPPAGPLGGPRQMQLVFTNVPGYQQAAAIERATRQLPDVSNVDVLEFERGRLVLQVDAADPGSLVAQVITASPSPMQLEAQEPDRLSFQLS